MKQSQSLLEFKTNIKTLRNIECSCKYVKYRKILAEKGWLLLAQAMYVNHIVYLQKKG